jgi:biotin carboxyl carrier protein
VATRGTRDDEQPTLDDVTATVRSLVEVMRGNGLTELDVKCGPVSIHLRAPKGGGPKAAPAREDGAEAPEDSIAPSEGHIVTAPMIGTFYVSPAPGEPPFVRVGDLVRAGQTIGIIEAM